MRRNSQIRQARLRHAGRCGSIAALQALDSFERVFARKGSEPKKLQEVDERWLGAHKIEARFGTVVTQFNIERRLAVLANGESIEFTKACLAMGSRPVRPAMAGTSLGNVIYLRTVRDALALREMATLEKTIMVVGVVCWHANRQQACA